MENREICKAFLCVYWKSCAIAKCRYTLYSGYVLIELHKLVVICKQRLMEMYIYVYCVERRASDLKREMQQNNIFALFLLLLSFLLLFAVEIIQFAIESYSQWCCVTWNTQLSCACVAKCRACGDAIESNNFEIGLHRIGITCDSCEVKIHVGIFECSSLESNAENRGQCQLPL